MQRTGLFISDLSLLIYPYLFSPFSEAVLIIRLLRTLRINLGTYKDQ
jgi:hypothetical protein